VNAHVCVAAPAARSSPTVDDASGRAKTRSMRVGTSMAWGKPHIFPMIIFMKMKRGAVNLMLKMR
jgi:hypothetical protein